MKLALIILLVANYTAAEYHSAVVRLFSLINTEHKLLATLDKYIEGTEKRLDRLKTLRDRLNEEHAKAIVDTDTYLSNPINCFLVVKRLHHNWMKIEQTLVTDKGPEIADRIEEKRSSGQLPFPTPGDFAETSVSIGRLQTLYKLNITEFVQGTINGTKYKGSLDWTDCYDIGAHLYDEGRYGISLVWLNESLRLGQDLIKCRKRFLLFYLIAASLYAEGEFEEAAKYWKKTKELIPPDHSDLETVLQLDKNIELNKNRKVVRADLSYYYPYEMYCELCRKGRTGPLLNCRYKNDHPYLMLNKLKEELISVDPPVSVFHDVVTKREITSMFEVGIPMLRRALVFSDTGNSSTSKDRLGQVCWLKENDDPAVLKLRKRAGYMTGLDTSTAELFQLQNYGIGGHYEPHYDFFKTSNTADLSSESGRFQRQDRIATVLFYLSNVEQGGFTSFPWVNITVEPVKGTALVWYNLHRSGEPDYRTLHSACPVLVGSKWIGTVWFNEAGQEFLRPCNLVKESSEAYRYNFFKRQECARSQSYSKATSSLPDKQ